MSLSPQYLKTVGMSALFLRGFLLRSIASLSGQLHNVANILKGRSAVNLNFLKSLILPFQLCTKGSASFKSPPIVSCARVKAPSCAHISKTPGKKLIGDCSL